MKMYSKNYYQCAVIGTLLLAGSAIWADEEKEIALTDVPASVVEAARGAVDGLQIKSAEVELENGQKVYELEGTADGVEYEIEVSADGTVLEVETDD